MKQFFTVISFELSNYFKKKGYIITTIFISLIFVIGLSIPSFFNLSKLIPQLSKTNDSKIEEQTTDTKDKGSLAIYDSSNVIKDLSLIEPYFHGYSLKLVSSSDQVKNLVTSKDVKAGFIVNSLTSFDYYVDNTHLTDMNTSLMENALSNLYRMDYSSKEGIDYNKLSQVINTPIQSNVTILGKDSVGNYVYTYLLVFLLYMMILYMDNL